MSVVIGGNVIVGDNIVLGTKQLKIIIDYPSCRASGVASDDFAAALKHEFAQLYDLEIKIEAAGGFYVYGISKTAYNFDDKDDALNNRIIAIFLNLPKKVDLHNINQPK